MATGLGPSVMAQILSIISTRSAVSGGPPAGDEKARERSAYPIYLALLGNR